MRTLLYRAFLALVLDELLEFLLVSVGKLLDHVPHATGAYWVHIDILMRL